MQLNTCRVVNLSLIFLWLQVRDVRAACSAVPKIRPQWTDRYMKILVVGESGEKLFFPHILCVLRLDYHIQHTVHCIIAGVVIVALLAF